jgi:hypothetical protein
MAPNPISNSKIQVAEVISNQDARSFCLSIESTLLKAPPSLVNEIYFFIQTKRAIALSFDGNWRPFIGTNIGYNYPEERIYVNGGGAFLALVRSRFKNMPHEMAGGRVFLAGNRAYRIEAGYERTFLKWVWLGRNLDLVSDILSVLDKVLK